MITLYTYKGCTSCRNATLWLIEHGIQSQERPIRETPPRKDELKRMLAFLDGNLKRLFNTSGQDYRRLGISAKLDNLTAEAALELLAANGNLIKRPFVLGAEFGLVGFNPIEWSGIRWPGESQESEHISPSKPRDRNA